MNAESEKVLEKIEHDLRILLVPFGFEVSRDRERHREFRMSLECQPGERPNDQLFRFALVREISQYELADHGFCDWAPNYWAMDAFREATNAFREHAKTHLDPLRPAGKLVSRPLLRSTNPNAASPEIVAKLSNWQAPECRPLPPHGTPVRLSPLGNFYEACTEDEATAHVVFHPFANAGSVV